MAVIIDDAWLAEQGVDADGKEADELIDTVMDELEFRTGMEIAGKLTTAQIEEFERIPDEDARIDWLDNALPTYPQIVDQKTAEIAAELKRSSDKLAVIKSWAQN